MYGKLFAQMFDGSLRAKGPWQAIVTFQQMIILCDKRGVIDMTPEAISARTSIPVKILNIGIQFLEQPDTESRTPDEEGRRIVRLSDEREWGWRIVNYEHYRKIRSSEERREYQRQYYQHRKKKPKAVETQQVNPRSTHSTDDSTNSSKQYAVSSKQHPDSGESDAKYKHFPTDLCKRLYQVATKTGHVTDYPRFRKALALLYPRDGPLYPEDALSEGIVAFYQAADGLPPKDAKYETIERFVQSVGRFVELGKMPLVNENGVTERGRIAAGSR